MAGTGNASQHRTDRRPAHAMPFGAEVQAGGVRFRLWAPSAGQVDLVLGDSAAGRRLAMEDRGGGWFELFHAEARAGTRYRYALPSGLLVPDPASRFQGHDVHGPSTVIDPGAYQWQQADWRGRPWEETVLYELHVGTFTPEGTYAAAIDRLDHLMRLGVTAVELMPLAEFAGDRGWGYDGVLPFAPEAGYGKPEDLKAFIDALHERGMMAFLDVVYNHFGPEGNYLHAYAASFFTDRHMTPWGQAVNYDGADAGPVRDFVVHNALYWLEEYRFDGLRLDAVHAIVDESAPDILDRLATEVRARFPDRHVHLVLENDQNAARRLERGPDGRPKTYSAQWNDDWHHAAHALLTGEAAGYYADYARDPAGCLLRALVEGFVQQGESSSHRGGFPRGEPSAHLPATAFVAFLQNHDQIGNRAFGERLTVLADPRHHRVLSSLLLLAPHIPLLFMGEEWGSRTPFLYFCDFHGDLAAAVRDGRRKEFAGFPAFADPAARARIPDPVDPATFQAARLNWDELEKEEHEDWLALHEVLLRLRHTAIVPRLKGLAGHAATGRRIGGRGLAVTWRLADGAELSVTANLGPDAQDGIPLPAGDPLFETEEGLVDRLTAEGLPGWSACWFLTEGRSPSQGSDIGGAA